MRAGTRPARLRFVSAWQRRTGAFIPFFGQRSVQAWCLQGTRDAVFLVDVASLKARRQPVGKVPVQRSISRVVVCFAFGNGRLFEATLVKVIHPVGHHQARAAAAILNRVVLAKRKIIAKITKLHGSIIAKNESTLITLRYGTAVDVPLVDLFGPVLQTAGQVERVTRLPGQPEFLTDLFGISRVVLNKLNRRIVDTIGVILVQGAYFSSCLPSASRADA